MTRLWWFEMILGIGTMRTVHPHLKILYNRRTSPASGGCYEVFCLNKGFIAIEISLSTEIGMSIIPRWRG